MTKRRITSKIPRTPATMKRTIFCLTFMMGILGGQTMPPVASLSSVLGWVVCAVGVVGAGWVARCPAHSRAKARLSRPTVAGCRRHRCGRGRPRSQGGELRVGRKPGSVYAAIYLGLASPPGSSGFSDRPTGPAIACLPCTRRVCLSRRVTTALVSSYLAVSPLPADSLTGIQASGEGRCRPMPP
jgi:hypothetical protein